MVALLGLGQTGQLRRTTVLVLHPMPHIGLPNCSLAVALDAMVARSFLGSVALSRPVVGLDSCVVKAWRRVDRSAAEPPLPESR